LIAGVVTGGHVMANDISPKSVESARQRTAHLRNVDFLVGDIVELRVDGSFDFIVLPDVLEHIPKEHHGRLFKKLATLLTPQGTIVVHIPSPQQIQWLEKHHPGHLQVIDQPIHLAELAPLLQEAGLYLRFVEHYGLWSTTVDAAVLFIEHYVEVESYSLLTTPRTNGNLLTRLWSRLVPKPRKPAQGSPEDAILFVTGWWPSSEDPHDGIFVREHAMALARHRKVVVLKLSLHKAGRFGVAYRESHDGDLIVCVVDITTPVRRFGLHDALVRRSYQRVLEDLSERFNFSLAHIHVRTPMTACFLDVADKRNMPVVVTEHNTQYHTRLKDASGVASSGREAVRRWFSSRVIRRVLPVSRDLGRTLTSEYGVEEDRITIVPNVASPVFKAISLAPPPPFRIALAARWSVNKDPLLFIQALKRIPQEELKGVEVDWIGDGAYMGQVQEEARDLGGMVTFRFHGYQAKPTVASILQRAHLLVHPTKAENLPCIIIESLVCGTPVLSNAVNGVPELIDAANGVLCPPGDPDAFANALRNCLRGRPDFDREGIARAALSRYSGESVALQLLQVYEEVLSTVP